jgi:transcription antitermination protein NusB
MNRHLSRSIILQTLFEWDFRKKSDIEVKEIFIRNTKEFASATKDFPFMESLLYGILKNKDSLDSIIAKAAPDWPVEKISIIDRNILRIGLYELIFGNREEVPPKVAINEAIELAKAFGGSNSGKFINGVLGTVYKEMGEPGKEEQSGKKRFVPESKEQGNLTDQTLVGAVVYAEDGEEIYLGLVHDVFGHWTLSKGKIDNSEEDKKGAFRKIKEELGIDAEIKEELGENVYIAHDPEKGKVKKRVKYFLAKAPFQDLKLGESGGLDDARWFKLKDILDLNFYNDIMPIITKAVNILLSKHHSKKRLNTSDNSQTD